MMASAAATRSIAWRAATTPGASVEWGTPAAIYDALDVEFRFTLDAAASRLNAKHVRFVEKETDALELAWRNERVAMLLEMLADVLAGRVTRTERRTGDTTLSVSYDAEDDSIEIRDCQTRRTALINSPSGVTRVSRRDPEGLREARVEAAARALWRMGNARIGERSWESVCAHYIAEATVALEASDHALASVPAPPEEPQ